MEEELQIRVRVEVEVEMENWWGEVESMRLMEVWLVELIEVE